MVLTRGTGPPDRTVLRGVSSIAVYEPSFARPGAPGGAPPVCPPHGL